MTLDGKQVCVVDDNIDAAESLSLLFEAEGYAVHTAHNGLEGLAMAREVRPFLAILDIGMPGMSGYELAARLRGEFGDAIRLIAVTGWGQPNDVERALAAGFDNHFTKPADPGILLSLVREYDSRATHPSPLQ